MDFSVSYSEKIPMQMVILHKQPWHAIVKKMYSFRKLTFEFMEWILFHRFIEWNSINTAEVIPRELFIIQAICICQRQGCSEREYDLKIMEDDKRY